MDLDILFVNDFGNLLDFDSFYLGQLSLNNVLKKSGKFKSLIYNHEIVNKGLMNALSDFKKIAEHLVSYNSKIIGFYSICYSFEKTIIIAKEVKRINPNIKVILGGPQASIVADECLKTFKFIDGISVGEGEKTIEILVDVLVNERDYENIPNFVYLDENNKVIRTKIVDFLNNEELANYIVEDLSPYIVTPETCLYLEGGRGCPFNCTFCTTSAYWEKKYRICNIDVLIDKMNLYHEQYGVSQFNIIHDLFMLDKVKIEYFCKKIIENKYKFKWKCSSRIDVIDEELLNLLSRGGCYHIYFGIESGSQRMQKIINKKLDLTRVVQILSYCKYMQIETTCSFVYGFADETEEDFILTLDLIKLLYINDIYKIQLHLFTPFPKTKETMKVFDKLFFDEKECIGLSIGEINNFTPEELNLIKNNKTIFSSYYNFSSTVRDLYRYIDVLINCISTTYDLFGYEIKKILNHRSLKSIFQENKGEIEACFNMILKIHERTSANINKILYRLMIDIIEKNIDFFNEVEIKLFNLNNTVFQLLYENIDCEKTVLVPFIYSETRQKNEIVFGDTFMKIKLKSNKIYISEKKINKLFESYK